MKKLLLTILFFLATPIFVHADITTGLIGWWKFDEGTGAVANDSSGNGNSGLLENGPTWVAGHIGPFALSFNGSSQYVTSAHSGAFAGSLETGSTWVNFTSLGAGENNMMMERDDGNSGGNTWGVDLETNGNNPRAQLVVSGSACTLIGNTTLSTGVWYLIAETYDGNNLNLYVNGVLDSASPVNCPGTLRGNGDHITIAGQGLTGGRYVSGTQDDVRYYNRALTSSDMTQLFQYTGNMVNPSSPSIVFISGRMAIRGSTRIN